MRFPSERVHTPMEFVVHWAHLFWLPSRRKQFVLDASSAGLLTAEETYLVLTALGLEDD